MAEVRSVEEALEKALRPIPTSELTDVMEKFTTIIANEAGNIDPIDFAKINFKLNDFIDTVKEVCLKASLHNEEPNP